MGPAVSPVVTPTMRPLRQLCLVYVGELAHRFPKQDLADLPVTILAQMLPFLSAAQLHRLDGVFSRAGISTEATWRRHLHQRWPHTHQRYAAVFGEPTLVDPHRHYMEKHFHELLRHAHFGQHTDPSCVLDTCLHHMISMRFPIREPSTSVVDLPLHQQLVRFAPHVHRLSITALQCCHLLHCAVLMAVLKQSVTTLDLHLGQNRFYQDMRAFLLALLVDGRLEHVALYNTRLSQRHTMDLLRVCVGYQFFRQSPATTATAANAVVAIPQAPTVHLRYGAADFRLQPSTSRGPRATWRLPGTFRAGSIVGTPPHRTTSPTDNAAAARPSPSKSPSDGSSSSSGGGGTGRQSQSFSLSDEDDDSDESGEAELDLYDTSLLLPTSPGPHGFRRSPNLGHTSGKRGYGFRLCSSDRSGHGKAADFYAQPSFDASCNKRSLSPSSDGAGEGPSRKVSKTDGDIPLAGEDVVLDMERNSHSSPVNTHQQDEIQQNPLVLRGPVIAALPIKCAHCQEQLVPNAEEDDSSLCKCSSDNSLSNSLSSSFNTERYQCVSSSSQFKTESQSKDHSISEPLVQELASSGESSCEELVPKLGLSPSPSIASPSRLKGDIREVEEDSPGTSSRLTSEESQTSNPPCYGVKSMALVDFLGGNLAENLGVMLHTWTGLETLTLISNSTKSTVLSEILLVRLEAGNLRSLVLEDTPLCDSILGFLTRALTTKRSSPLKVMRLRNNMQDLCLKEGDEVTEVNETFVGTETLDLSYNTFQQSGIQRLGRLLRHDLALRHLSLEACHFSEAEVVTLLQAIQENGRVETLSLAENLLLSNSQSELIRTIEALPRLKSLNLNTCLIDAQLVNESFISAVLDHPSLERLTMATNRMGGYACHLLKKLLLGCHGNRNNSRPSPLKWLDLGYNFAPGGILVDVAVSVQAQQQPAPSRPLLSGLVLSGNLVSPHQRSLLLRAFAPLAANVVADTLDFSVPLAEHISQM